jgi:hypothetical protein
MQISIEQFNNIIDSKGYIVRVIDPRIMVYPFEFVINTNI